MCRNCGSKSFSMKRCPVCFTEALGPRCPVPSSLRPGSSMTADSSYLRPKSSGSPRTPSRCFQSHRRCLENSLHEPTLISFLRMPKVSPLTCLPPLAHTPISLREAPPISSARCSCPGPHVPCGPARLVNTRSHSLPKITYDGVRWAWVQPGFWAPPFPDSLGQGGVCSPGTFKSIERWRGLFLSVRYCPTLQSMCPKTRYSVTTEQGLEIRKSQQHCSVSSKLSSFLHNHLL